MLLVGLTLAANAVLYLLLAQGVAVPLPAEAQAVVVKQFSAMTPGLALMGGVERLSSICVHLAATLLVLRTVTTGAWRWYGLALGYHALGNLAGVEVTRHFGAFWGESCIAAFAAAGVAFLVAEHRRARRLAPAG